MSIHSKIFTLTLTAITTLEVISFFGYLADPINHVVFILLLLTMLALSLWKLEYGLWVVFAELVIGSKGYLFSWPVGDFHISIRLGLFLVLLLAWGFQVIRKKDLAWWKSTYTKPFLLLMAALVYAVTVGFINHNSFKYIFLDGNGFLYFGLFFVVLQVMTSRERIWRLISVISAGIASSVLKTIFLLFAFSHQLHPFLGNLYRWVRFTGVGEITQLSNGFYRIFFQSHIYEVFAYFFLLIGLVLWWKQPHQQKQWMRLYARWMLLGSTVLISLSRSFWLGLAVGLCVLFLVTLQIWHWKWKSILLGGVFLGISTALQLGILGAIVNVPLPGTTSVSIASLIEERTSDVTEEAAGASRFALLKPLFTAIAEHPVWGQGFGTTVSYASQDPRAIEASGGGLYTTFAFEWGYLDLWLKLGL
ncbi:MAG: O-antigen ligase family protein, partial [Patescibacteria group bacterium]